MYRTRRDLSLRGADFCSEVRGTEALARRPPVPTIHVARHPEVEHFLPRQHHSSKEGEDHVKTWTAEHAKGSSNEVVPVYNRYAGRLQVSYNEDSDSDEEEEKEHKNDEVRDAL